MSYVRIRKEDWSVIARMLRARYAGAEIARTLGKDPSAVNRHIKAANSHAQCTGVSPEPRFSAVPHEGMGRNRAELEIPRSPATCHRGLVK